MFRLSRKSSGHLSSASNSQIEVLRARKHQKPIKNPQQDELHRKTGPVIGRGSFGIVYVATGKVLQDSNAESVYAVKVVSNNMTTRMKAGKKKLISEHCILSALQHQNVIETVGIKLDKQGNVFHMMELCTGGDLQNLIIDSGTLKPPKANRLFLQLMTGVDFLHQAGVTHRDIKPANLLLTGSGDLKIADFGFAECFRLPWECGVHKITGFRGTKGFLAPEVFTETWFDPRAVDVWACGVVYLAMRIGKLSWLQARTGIDKDYDANMEDRENHRGLFGPSLLDHVGFSLIKFLRKSKTVGITFEDSPIFDH
ncbi:MAG: hypothetical protein LQ351_000638 [Letrouitia transgressa]|nr:MAG: hypothetical protein LQ351_000638 [Letrouitia transgressa]